MDRADVVQRVRQLYTNNGSSPVQQPDLRVVSCHLGGSSSVTGLRSGLAIGNSLGMSPQSGIPHNNRVGELDSFALPFMMKSRKLSLEQAEQILCKESGLKGLSGGLNDVRDITAAAEKGDDRARLALEVFVHQVRHWIGAYFLQLNGLDALVFTAGIGENRVGLRSAICQDLHELGIKLDESINAGARGNRLSVQQTQRCE